MIIKKLLIIEYVLITLLVLFNIYLRWDPIYNKLKEWKVVPLPEPFTELYFTEHLMLPTTIAEGQNQYFEFTISNVEDKTMTYNWTVYAVEDENYFFKETSESTQTTQEEEPIIEKKYLIASGRESMLNGEKKNIGVNFKLDKVFARQKIVVELADMDQKIHYWVTGK